MRPSRLRVDGLSIAAVGPMAVAEEERILVDGLSFEVVGGEATALVGGSGCGKSISLLALLGLLPPGLRVVAGSARLDPFRPSTAVDGGTDRPAVELLASGGAAPGVGVRGRRVALVPQETSAALNPVRTLGSQLAEVLRVHRGLRGRAARRRGLELLEQVAMPDPARCWRAHPHELSGGQQQRAILALALAGEPEILLADEPTTALDVTLQAQILELLASLRRRLGLAIVLVTHDLAVVAEACRRAVVMDAGRVVERGTIPELFRSPSHPVTRELLAAALRGERALDGSGRGTGTGSGAET